MTRLFGADIDGPILGRLPSGRSDKRTTPPRAGLIGRYRLRTFASCSPTTSHAFSQHMHPPTLDGMPLPPPLDIEPPLLNTANPWATDLADLTRLYDCPHTGAVTTRTALLDGFAHDPAQHAFVFFEAAAHDPAKAGRADQPAASASFNTLGYSPLPLDQYLGFVRAIAARTGPAPDSSSSSSSSKKGFLVSVTGGPEDVAACYRRIASAQAALPPRVPLAMEVNLSCPNIPGKPPPAYNGEALLAYLAALRSAIAESARQGEPRIAVGFKTPPYTHAGQFTELIDALRAGAGAGDDGVCPLSFLTATNTLGSSLVLSTSPSGSVAPALPGNGTGLGGMAGAPLHPLALGNVATLRKMLDAHPGVLGHIRIVGAGGVADAAGFARMRQVGASAVGVGTALGMHGVDVFGTILSSS